MQFLPIVWCVLYAVMGNQELEVKQLQDKKVCKLIRIYYVTLLEEAAYQSPKKLEHQDDILTGLKSFFSFTHLSGKKKELVTPNPHILQDLFCLLYVNVNKDRRQNRFRRSDLSTSPYIGVPEDVTIF